MEWFADNLRRRCEQDGVPNEFWPHHGSLAKDIREETEKALKQLQKGESPEKVLEALSIALSNKFLHAPSHALNQSHGEEHAKLEDTLKQLYQIKS